MNDRFYGEQIDDLISINKQNRQFNDLEIDFLSDLSSYNDDFLEQLIYCNDNEMLKQVYPDYRTAKNVIKILKDVLTERLVDLTDDEIYQMLDNTAKH
jgi:hypothetical protein